MKYGRSHRRLLAVAVSSLLVCGTAVATTDTANLTVSATVTGTCALTSAPTLGFGTVNQLGNTDAQANITYWCTNGTSASITLGGGGSGDINARRMGTALAPLGYQLYTTAARTAVWGDGVGNGNAVTVTGTGYSAAGTPVAVYGRVPAASSATASAGGYSDTVVITITF